MSYIDQHLQPGEIVLDRIQRSRKWHDVGLSFLVNTLAGVAVWYAFDQAQRLVVESYIRSTVFEAGTRFMAINLMLGLLPFMVMLVLVQDFLFTFFVELALTDRRVFGRVNGLFWLKEISIGLDEIEEMRSWYGYLTLRVQGSLIYLSGIYNTRHFLDTFRQVTRRVVMRPARLDRITEPLAAEK